MRCSAARSIQRFLPSTALAVMTDAAKLESTPTLSKSWPARKRPGTSVWGRSLAEEEEEGGRVKLALGWQLQRGSLTRRH